MRRFAVTIALAALALGAGCQGEGNEEKSRGEQKGEPVGSVLEASGDVTATREGEDTEPRELEAGSLVYADDVIATGAEGSVRLRLDHNGALWELGSDERRRVDDSLAWRAPEGDESSDSEETETREDEESVAGGRHAEAASAETRTTAPEKSDEAAEAQKESPSRPSRRRRARREKTREPESAPEASAPASGAEPERSAIEDSSIGQSMAPSDAATPAGDEAPSRIELQEQVMEVVRGHLRRCFDEVSAGRDAGLGGRLRVAIRLDSQGRVESLDLEPGRGDLSGIPACAKRVLGRAQIETYGRSLGAEFRVTLPGR